jgi:hypothetical protein
LDNWNNWLIISVFTIKKPLNPVTIKEFLREHCQRVERRNFDEKEHYVVAGQTKILISKFPLRIFCEKRYGWKSSYHYGV